MKEGKFRYIESLILSLCFVYLQYWVLEDGELAHVSNFFKVSAAVVTASGVVAYNLRNRVVDFSKYLIARSYNYKQLSDKTKKVCHRLTFIVFFSFISGLWCLLAGVYSNDFITTIAGISFIFSMIFYSHVIFAFDELEETMLNTAVENREQEEEEKAKQATEIAKQEHPDNF